MRDLEINALIIRKVYDTIAVTIEYELTQSGRTFQTVIDAMLEWGIEHSKNIIGQRE